MSNTIYQNLPQAENMLELEIDELAGYVLEHLHADQHNRPNRFHPGNLSIEVARHYPPLHTEEISNLVRQACQWLKNRDFLYEVNEQGFFDFTKLGKRTTTAEALHGHLTPAAVTEKSSTSFAQVNLDGEQEELFRKLVEAQQSLPKYERQDFMYSPAYTRVFGARKREEWEKAIDEGGSVLFQNQVISKKEDIPWNLDHDIIMHPGLPDGRIDTTQSDIDTLTIYNLIHFRDQTSFFIHPDGMAYYLNNSVRAAGETESTLLRQEEVPQVPPPLHLPKRTARDPYRIVGTVLANKYELIEFAGSGGMGVVYRARKLDDDSIIAVKVLKPDIVAGNPEYANLFVREAEIVRGLNHPHIVKIFDSGEHEDLSFMVMEWVEGKSIEEHLGRGLLNEDSLVNIFQQVCDAVGYAHQKNIIHLDLKPGNILLISSMPEFVKVIDFGLSRVIRQESGTTVTRFRGTFQYCAPEQFGGRVSFRSDIYSLGATLYTLITGLMPFSTSYVHAKQHPNLELPEIPSIARQRGFPSAIDKVIAKALNKNPDLRQQSTNELFREFADAIHVDGLSTSDDFVETSPQANAEQSPTQSKPETAPAITAEVASWLLKDFFNPTIELLNGIQKRFNQDGFTMSGTPVQPYSDTLLYKINFFNKENLDELLSSAPGEFFLDLFPQIKDRLVKFASRMNAFDESIAELEGSIEKSSPFLKRLVEVYGRLIERERIPRSEYENSTLQQICVLLLGQINLRISNHPDECKSHLIRFVAYSLLDLKVNYPLHALPDDFRLLSFAKEIAKDLEGKDGSVQTSLTAAKDLFNVVGKESEALWNQSKADRAGIALKYHATF
jgi:serine/threonine protein kinase